MECIFIHMQYATISKNNIKYPLHIGRKMHTYIIKKTKIKIETYIDIPINPFEFKGSSKWKNL